MNLDKQLIDVGLGVVAADLARLLDEMGLPPLAEERAHRREGRRQLRGSARQRRRQRAGHQRGRAQAARARRQVRPRARDAAPRQARRPAVRRADRRPRHRPAVGEARQQAAEVTDRRREAGPARHRSRDAGAERRSGRAGCRCTPTRTDRSTPSPRASTVPAGTPVTLLGDKYSLGPVEVLLETDKSGKNRNRQRR